MNSNDLNKAMLTQQLDGNEIKVILAYISKGGWQEGVEVFLPESVIKEYGMNKSTIKRHRKELIRKGWMVPTGNKSQWGCDKYLIQIPKVVQSDPPSTKVAQSEPVGGSNLNQGEGQFDPHGGSIMVHRSNKEVIREVTKRSNTSVADAPSVNPTNKKNIQAAAPPKNTPYSTSSVAFPEGPVVEGTEDRVVQNEPPSPEDKARAAVIRENDSLTEEQVQEAIDKILNRAGFMSNVHPIDYRARYAVDRVLNGELQW